MVSCRQALSSTYSSSIYLAGYVEVKDPSPHDRSLASTSRLEECTYR